MSNLARFLILGALTAHGVSAHAQTRNVSGRVIRADSAPLGDVRVMVSMVGDEGPPRTVVSGKDGRFTLGLRAAEWKLEARAIGFKPWAGSIHVGPHGNLNELVIMLEIVPPVPLDEVTIRSPLSNLEGFEERRSRGPGTFFTREDIRRMQPRVFTDVLRRAPGVFLRGVPTGFGEHLTAMSSRTRPCPMAYVLNGSPLTMPNDMAVDLYVVASEVVAVEVYTGSSRIPAQFNASSSTARCGVIVIWTRNGRAP